MLSTALARAPGRDRKAARCGGTLQSGFVRVRGSYLEHERSCLAGPAAKGRP